MACHSMGYQWRLKTEDSLSIPYLLAYLLQSLLIIYLLAIHIPASGSELKNVWTSIILWDHVLTMWTSNLVYYNVRITSWVFTDSLRVMTQFGLAMFCFLFPIVDVHEVAQVISSTLIRKRSRGVTADTEDDAIVIRAIRRGHTTGLDALRSETQKKKFQEFKESMSSYTSCVLY